MTVAARGGRRAGVALAGAAALLAGCDMLKLAEQEQQYVRDRQILTRTLGVLSADPLLVDERIDVTVFLREVTLSGSVADARARDRAVELARAVTHVRGVENRLGTRGPAPPQPAAAGAGEGPVLPPARPAERDLSDPASVGAFR